jgi:hypothetical protein
LDIIKFPASLLNWKSRLDRKTFFLKTTTTTKLGRVRVCVYYWLDEAIAVGPSITLVASKRQRGSSERRRRRPFGNKRLSVRCASALYTAGAVQHWPGRGSNSRQHTHTHTHTLSAEFLSRVFDIRNATAWCISAIVKTSANPARRLKCRIYLADIGDIKEGQGQQWIKQGRHTV